MPGTNLHDDQGYIFEEDMHSNNITRTLFRIGTTVPADGTAGYTHGAIFCDIDGGSASALYVNVGSSISCNFDAILVNQQSVANNLDFGNIGTTSTVFLIPVDRNNPVAGKNVAGRLAVAFGEAGSSVVYIPVYYA